MTISIVNLFNFIRHKNLQLCLRCFDINFCFRLTGVLFNCLSTNQMRSFFLFIRGNVNYCELLHLEQELCIFYSSLIKMAYFLDFKCDEYRWLNFESQMWFCVVIVVISVIDKITALERKEYLIKDLSKNFENQTLLT